jgi:hypothetical protein
MMMANGRAGSGHIALSWSLNAAVSVLSWRVRHEFLEIAKKDRGCWFGDFWSSESWRGRNVGHPDDPPEIGYLMSSGSWQLGSGAGWWADRQEGWWL